MSLLAVSALALLVGALVFAFLAMRFAMKVMWKLAMVGVAIAVISIAAGAAYFWLEGPFELPSMPGASADR